MHQKKKSILNLLSLCHSFNWISNGKDAFIKLIFFFFFCLTVLNEGTSIEVITCIVTSKPFTSHPLVLLQIDDYD